MSTVDDQCLPLVLKPCQWIGGLLCGLVAYGWLGTAPVYAAPGDTILPITSITSSPMANNRRAVIIQGTAKDVSAYEGRDGYGRPICGQGFILEDETGSLDVLYLIRCQANETPVLVSEDEHVMIHATINVSIDNVQKAEGKDLVLKAMATKIIRRK